jgi:23S rRNA pseudouridine1911/1915/1917 synthase
MAARAGADNRRRNIKGTPLGQDSFLEADSISAGVEPTEADAVDEQAELRRCEVPAALHGWRIDRALAQLVPEFSRSHLQQLLAEGCVRWRGQACAKASIKVAVGDAIEVSLRPTAQARAFVPQAMALDVRFEDQHLLVLDKPAGLVVHPAAGHWSGTLLNGLLAHHAAAALLPRAGIVHRLDKDTSGLMMVAKSRQAMDALVRAIAAREVNRQYLALAHGAWRGSDQRSLQGFIGRDPHNRLRMALVGEGSGKPAQTDLLRVDGHDLATLVACKLHTGRTHQIRVHLSSIGHPLVGDAVYGGRPAWGLQRQGLHASFLCLKHPVDGVELGFWCDPPADFRDALAQGGLRYNAPPAGRGLIA